MSIHRIGNEKNSKKKVVVIVVIVIVAKVLIVVAAIVNRHTRIRCWNITMLVTVMSLSINNNSTLRLVS